MQKSSRSDSSYVFNEEVTDQRISMQGWWVNVWWRLLDKTYGLKYEISGGAKLVGDEPSKLTMGVTLWIDWILSLDLIVLNFLSYNLLFFGVVVVIVLQFLSTPYGRYARGGWGAGVNARVAWFVQEIPAFVVPLLLVYFTECPKLEFTPNKILLGLYLFHYFQR